MQHLFAVEPRFTQPACHMQRKMCIVRRCTALLLPRALPLGQTDGRTDRHGTVLILRYAYVVRAIIVDLIRSEVVRTLVALWPSPASGTVAEAFASHRITRHSIAASTDLATLVAVVTRWARRRTRVTLIARLTLTPAILARQQHQRCARCVIIRPHRTHRVQRCGLLLPMFRGLCGSVC